MLIVSFNSADVLRDCLASIEHTVPGTPIAIREHGSDPVALDRLSALATSHPGQVRLDFDVSNPGFGAGCNALARESRATHLMMFNPDAMLVAWPWTPDAPPPAGAIVGPQMLGERDGDHSGTSYRVRDEIARSWFRRRGQRPNGRGFVSGAALLIDRESFMRLGGFDEGYFLFYEDIDLCERANRMGIFTTVDDRWQVRHAGAHSTNAVFGQALQWSYDSAVRFHGRRGGVAGYRVYVVVDSLLRALIKATSLRSDSARAYLHLARRAAGDLVNPAPGGPTPTPTAQNRQARSSARRSGGQTDR